MSPKQFVFQLQYNIVFLTSSKFFQKSLVVRALRRQVNNLKKLLVCVRTVLFAVNNSVTLTIYIILKYLLAIFNSVSILTTIH